MLNTIAYTILNPNRTNLSVPTYLLTYYAIRQIFNISNMSLEHHLGCLLSKKRDPLRSFVIQAFWAPYEQSL